MTTVSKDGFGQGECLLTQVKVILVTEKLEKALIFFSLSKTLILTIFEIWNIRKKCPSDW